MPKQLLNPNVGHRIWDRLQVWIVFVAVVASVFLFAYALFAIHETHSIVVSHNAELNQLKSQYQTLLKIETDSSLNHGQTLATLSAICKSIPGCVLP